MLTTPDTLTLPQVAKKYGVSSEGIRGWIQSGQLNDEPIEGFASSVSSFRRGVGRLRAASFGSGAAEDRAASQAR